MQNYILAARTAQGIEDWQVSSQIEREEVISRWNSIQATVARHEKLPDHGSHPLQQTALSELALCGTSEQSHQSCLLGGRLADQATLPEDTAPSACNSNTTNDNILGETDQEHSVRPPSGNNTEEYELIERAIRASLTHTNVASEQDNGEDSLRRAVQASIAEANRTEHYEYSYRQQLEEALQQSLHTETSKYQEK